MAEITWTSVTNSPSSIGENSKEANGNGNGTVLENDPNLKIKNKANVPAVSEAEVQADSSWEANNVVVNEDQIYRNFLVDNQKHLTT